MGLQPSLASTSISPPNHSAPKWLCFRRANQRSANACRDRLHHFQHFLKTTRQSCNCNDKWDSYIQHLPARIAAFLESESFADFKRLAMDGQRPMEELSEASNLSRVFKFNGVHDEERTFTVVKIADPTEATQTTVVRLLDDEDVRTVCFMAL